VKIESDGVKRLSAAGNRWIRLRQRLPRGNEKWKMENDLPSTNREEIENNEHPILHFTFYINHDFDTKP
jgi:hypothetical protein